MARMVAQPRNDVYFGMLVTVVAAMLVGIMALGFELMEYETSSPAVPAAPSLPPTKPLDEVAGGAAMAEVPSYPVAAQPEPKPEPAAKAVEPPVALPALPVVVLAPKPVEAVPIGPVPSPLSIPSPFAPQPSAIK